MYNLSASDGRKFAQFMREMTERIIGLGPNPIKTARCLTPNALRGGLH